MLELRQTESFAKWREKLKDLQGRALIASRLDRLRFGHAGDARPLGGGVSELRIDHGPGYRIYLLRPAGNAVVLLCGGHKGTQSRDILKAKRLAAEVGDDELEAHNL